MMRATCQHHFWNPARTWHFRTCGLWDSQGGCGEWSSIKLARYLREIMGTFLERKHHEREATVNIYLFGKLFFFLRSSRGENLAWLFWMLWENTDQSSGSRIHFQPCRRWKAVERHLNAWTATSEGGHLRCHGQTKQHSHWFCPICKLATIALSLLLFWRRFWLFNDLSITFKSHNMYI